MRQFTDIACLKRISRIKWCKSEAPNRSKMTVLNTIKQIFTEFALHSHILGPLGHNLSVRSLINPGSEYQSVMVTRDDQHWVTPGGVKTITRLVQQPPGPEERRGRGPDTNWGPDMAPWGPGPPPPRPLRWSDWSLGQQPPMSAPLLHQILTSIVLGMDHIPAISHIPRVDAKQTRFSSPSSWSSLHSDLSTFLVRPGPSISPGIVASSQVWCPLIDGMEGTQFLTACHLCWEILLSLMYPLWLCYFVRSRKCWKITFNFKCELQDSFTKRHQQHLIVFEWKKDKFVQQQCMNEDEVLFQINISWFLWLTHFLRETEPRLMRVIHSQMSPLLNRNGHPSWDSQRESNNLNYSIKLIGHHIASLTTHSHLCSCRHQPKQTVIPTILL